MKSPLLNLIFSANPKLATDSLSNNDSCANKSWALNFISQKIVYVELNLNRLI